MASSRPKFDAATAELLRDPHRSNAAIAAAAGRGRATVRIVRGRLLAAGRIGRRNSRRDAIAAALETWDGTNRELAAQLGVDPSYISHVRRQVADEARRREMVEGNDGRQSNAAVPG